MTQETYGINADRGELWLGLDPGVTTGWAAIAPDGSRVGSGNLKVEFLRDDLDRLIRGFHRMGYTVMVVVEKMPRVGGLGALASTMEQVWQIMFELIDQVYELPYTMIAPGEWKPSRVARTTKLERGLTTHQRDAIRMTLYAKEKGKPNGH